MAGFGVTITAVDKATATIATINKALATLTKPATQMQTSLAKLGKESGLDVLSKKLGSVGGAAVDAVDKLGVLGTSASGLFGVGSLGGLALVARQWADAGNQITNTAYRIGISAGDLGKFESAARLAGVSSEAVAQGTAAMAKNIGDAFSGRDRGVMAGYFAQLGIGLHRAADGTIDFTAVYQDLKRALDQAPDAQAKNAILNALGQPEEMRRYIENMNALTREAGALHPNLDAAANKGKELKEALARVSEGAAGLAENIEVQLAPGMLKILNYLGDLEKKAVDMTKSGLLQRVLTIASGAATGALTGAASGILIGGALGAAGGPAGIAGGAVVGGITGAIRGGVAGGAIAGGVDALGHAGAEHPWGIGELGGVQNGMSGRIAPIQRDIWGRPIDRTSAEADIPPEPGIQPSGPVGIGDTKWHNPGNLRVPGSRTMFQTFRSDEEGLTAAAGTLERYQTKHGVNTIAGIANRWAPPGENDTAGYVQRMSEATGYNPNQQLDLTEPNTNAAILSAIVRNEQGRQPFTPEQMKTAVSEALRENAAGIQTAPSGSVNVNINNAPAGTTATASTSNPNWSVRTIYSLPTGATNP